LVATYESETANVARNLMSFFNLNSDFIPQTCLYPMDYFNKFGAALLIPLILMGLLAIIYLTERIWFRISKDSSPFKRILLSLDSSYDYTLQSIHYRYVKGVFSILIFSYAPICKFVLQTLSCLDFGPAGRYSLLIADPSISCSESQYKEILGLAIFLVVVYVIPAPLAVLALLLVMKHRVKGGLDNPKVEGYLGSLYTSYKDPYYWWEVIMISRRTLLAIFYTSFGGFDSDIRILVLVYYLLFLMVLQLALQPFTLRSSNYFELASLFILLVLALLDSSIVAASATNDGIGVVFILLVIFVLLMSFSLFGKKIRKYWTNRNSRRSEVSLPRDSTLPPEEEKIPSANIELELPSDDFPQEKSNKKKTFFS